MAATGQFQGKEYFDLMKGIAEARSKEEEDQIIRLEIAQLKEKMQQPKVPAKKMKEYLVRLIYCEMLGHEVSFGYIHAVKMCSEVNIMEKRIGYMTVGLCMSDQHELILLLINTLQRDLSSHNFMDVCTALGIIGRVVNTETIPAVLPLVVKLLSHEQAIVRKKAVMALLAFFMKSPVCVGHLEKEVKTVLCDRDPSVMGACLCLLTVLVKDAPEKFSTLTGSLLNILRQVIEHRLPRDYDYHRLPAPWVIMKILKVLAVIGADNEKLSQSMYDLLSEVMRRVDTGINIGYAVLYECVKTVTMIYPSDALIQQAAGCVGRVLENPSNTIKYAGINALAEIVKIDTKYVAEHQGIIIECLQDPDETIQRKTLDLLYRITTLDNVEVIVDRMLAFLKKPHEVFMKRGIVKKICTLAEEFAPSSRWYVDTICAVFLQSGDLVPPEASQTFLHLVAEGSGEDDEEDEELRRYTVNLCFDTLQEKVIPDVFMRNACWILGEFGYLSVEYSSDEVIFLLCDLMENRVIVSETRSWIVASIMKIVAQFQKCPEEVVDLVEKYSASRSFVLQQRCNEFLVMMDRMDVMQSVLPADGSCEDVEVDESLSFLNSFVKKSSRHAPVFKKSTEDVSLFSKLTEPVKKKDTGLKFEAYEAPKSRSTATKVHETSTEKTYEEYGTPSHDHQQKESVEVGSGIRVGGSRRVWGPDGIVEKEKEPSKSPKKSVSVSSVLTEPSHEEQSEPVAETLPLSTIVSQEEKKAVVQKQEKKQKTEKEKLAESLFGGSKTRGKRVKNGEGRKPRGATGRIQSPSKPEVLPQKKVVEDVSLLDFMSEPVVSSSSSSQQSNVFETKTTQHEDDILDLLSGPIPSTSLPPPQMDTLTPEGSDVLLNDGSSSVVSTVAAVGSEKILFSDINVYATVGVSLDSECLGLVVKFKSKRNVPLSDIKLEFQAASKISIEVLADPPFDVMKSKIMCSQYPSGGNSNILIKMTPISSGFGGNLLGNLSYRDETGRSQLIRIQEVIPAGHFIRENVIDTETFGGMWGRFGHERKSTARGGAVTTSVDVAAGILKKTCNVHVVEVISSEIISSGIFVGMKSVFLMHTRVESGGSISVTVRSKDTALSDCILRHVMSSGFGV